MPNKSKQKDKEIVVVNDDGQIYDPTDITRKIYDTEEQYAEQK
tara:strand:+ start:1210 stop:1338 length:129 start_codon:yes stop_codon:yes gene_type:complete